MTHHTQDQQRIQPLAVLRVLWSHLRPYRFAYFFVLSAVAAVHVADVFVPLYYKQFFDTLAGAGTDVTDTVVAGLVGSITAILVIHAFSWIVYRTMAVVHNWLQPRVMADLTQTAHAQLHKHSYSFFLDNFAGSLVRKVGRIERAYERLTDELQFKFLPLTVIMTGNLIVLYTRHPMLAFVLIAWIIVFLAFNTWFSIWKMKYDDKRVEIDSEATGVLADSISNAITVKLFTGFALEKNLYKNVTERLRKMQTFTWNLGEITDAIQVGLMFVIEFVLFYFAIQLYRDGVLTLGDFALIQGYLIGIFGKLWDFGRAIRHSYEAFADAHEMVEIMDLVPSVTDARNAKELKTGPGLVTFDNVYFSFHKTRRVLKGFNLEIQPGEKVALVGPSGAGKSTIVKLILRFYDVESGRILVDGQRIDRVTQESLRAAIAMVPQEPILFHRTIMENIRYGRQDATDAEVVDAAKKARCHDFILELPDGYDTYVGERGVKLSGGERQRVAIARAILKNAPILILDEATSSLDSESEALIQEALLELMHGKTAIVIAHRLSTIMHMDRIVVVENGHVTDMGTHQELLRRRKGTYKRLWEIQTSEYAN